MVRSTVKSARAGVTQHETYAAHWPATARALTLTHPCPTVRRGGARLGVSAASREKQTSTGCFQLGWAAAVSETVGKFSCADAGGEITCTNDSGASVRFSTTAVDSYSQDQADRYAKTHQIHP
jgi:hypothetical protein